jgi:hypothetical protein
MALTDIEKVRIEYGDTNQELPLLSDEEIQYFLDKNSQSIRLASIECARVALFKLSQTGDEQVSIFSIKGSKSASEYREALKLYINNASLNPMFSTAQGYAAGISKSDMLVYTSDSDSTIRNFDF